MRDVLTVLLSLAVIGCGARPTPTAVQTIEPDAVSRQSGTSAEAATAEEGADVQREPPSELPDTPGQAGDELSSSDAEAADGQAETAETPSETDGGASGQPPTPRERFALLAPGGPVVVDLVIRINGEAHDVTHARLIDAALAAADTDGDGRPTWEEVANSPRFAYGQFGNLPVEDEDQKAQLIRMYDRNGDELVNRSELPRFLTRNAGRARPFYFRSSNEFRGDNRTRSLVRLALDTDWDGAITQLEFGEAPSRLLMHDTNDDEILVLSDFKNGVDQQPGQMSNRRRTSQPDTGLQLSDTTDWSYAEYALRELYAYGDPLSPRDWPMVPQLFTRLDQDEDETLDQQEVIGLTDVPPHIELIVNFGASRQPGSDDAGTSPNLEIEIKSPELEAFVDQVHRYGNRISLVLRDAEIEFFVNEDPSLVDFGRVAESQFKMLDADGNGYLDEQEFPDRLPGYNVPLEGVDQNGDGQVYEEELARFLDLRQAAFRGQVRARAADQEDALFTALDTDGDGRLNSKEVHQAAERLQSMDRNHDGKLQSHEIPGSMVVGLIRGNPQQDNQLFTTPAVAGLQRGAELPRWFRGMDANGDGEISAREFIGPPQKFTDLDTDGNGFVSADELPNSAATKPTAG